MTPCQPLTLRPARPLIESVIDIRVAASDVLKLTLNEFNEAFRLVAKRLCYGWEPPSWVRRINRFNGPLIERLVEAAHTLLAEGFIVRIPDSGLHGRVVAGDYEEEWTRWVRRCTGGKYLDWFIISWGRREDLYGEAKRLPGARYSRPAVAVPAEYFEEVLDFSSVHDFRLSPGAEGLVAGARAARDEAVRVELKPRQPKPPKAAAVLAPPAVEIDDELRDDD